MISPESPGAASPKDDIKPQKSTEKPMNEHRMKKSDNRTIRFAKQQRIKPISNSFLASDKIRSLLWHPIQELEERQRHWKNGTPNMEIKMWEEGFFFLQMLDCSHIEAPHDDWSAQQEERVSSAIDAVLCEQGRQNRQQQQLQLQLQLQPKKQQEQQQQQQQPQEQQKLRPSHQTFTEIGISKEEKDRLRNKDQTPTFMIALQYGWHTGTATEAAHNRAIQLAMETKRLWQDDDGDTAIVKEDDGANKEKDHEEKKEEKESGKMQLEVDDKTEEESFNHEFEEEESLNDETDDPRQPLGIARGMSDHSAFSDLGGLRKRGSSRSVFENSMESLLDPANYLGDKVHLSLPTKYAGREHPRISATLKKQRSRARLSARSLALKEDIQVSGAKMQKLNVLKSISDRGTVSLDKEDRKEIFQDCVKKLINLNRFFQQVEGVSKDKALDTDKKKFLAAIAAKKSSVFQSMVIPENMDEPEDETKAREGAPIQVQSILLTPTIKTLRPKQKVVWREKLNRVKFFPEFPLSAEKEDYFYTSEDISRFRFEKFMEDHNDEYEEEVLESDEENDLEALNEDEDESSYEELSYHSDSESYYEEEEVEEPARDLASRFETQSVHSEGRRLSF